MEQNVTQYVDSLFTNITGFTQQEGLIGKLVKCEDKTFIPVMSVTLGTAAKTRKARGGRPGAARLADLEAWLEAHWALVPNCVQTPLSLLTKIMFRLFRSGWEPRVRA